MISGEKYNELVNSQKYVVGMERRGGDILFFRMTPKDPACYVGKQIPPMEFQDIRGKSFIAGKKNRITVLAFWGDRCPPCITLIDRLDSLASHNKRVSFVAVPTYGDTEKFFARHPWKNVYVPINYKGNYFKYFPEPVLAIIDRHGVLREMYWNYAFDKVMRFLEDNR